MGCHEKIMWWGKGMGEVLHEKKICGAGISNGIGLNVSHKILVDVMPVAQEKKCSGREGGSAKKMQMGGVLQKMRGGGTNKEICEGGW